MKKIIIRHLQNNIFPFWSFFSKIRQRLAFKRRLYHNTWNTVFYRVYVSAIAYSDIVVSQNPYQSFKDRLEMYEVTYKTAFGWSPKAVFSIYNSFLASEALIT